ncbi:alpha/beta hydrolase [Luteirhabdus pelagi]|uniref:alpha/beta hydrolase n=1 Tax=Luteirhabdus pelagi TaxID=2792783 RepID=UPI001939A690|nr:alpha/beta hydrolase [Luteirhabdus pelagi]
MKKILTAVYFSLLMICILGITSCSEDSSDTTSTPESLEAEIQMNVSYGVNSQQVYDIYLPANRSDTKTKVIVLVHGGGWTGGDKADMEPFISNIQDAHPDHAIVNMNYILAQPPAIPAFPNQFEDIGRVLNDLETASETFQIKPEFALIGASAGAHISLQYDAVYDATDRVKMVCDIVGPTDFTDPFYSDDPTFDFVLSALVDEDAYPNTTDYASAVSPALNISTTSSPTIMFYGDEDPLVPTSNAITLADALSAASVDNNYTIYNGGHGDWSEEDQENLQQQLSAYISTYFSIE